MKKQTFWKSVFTLLGAIILIAAFAHDGLKTGEGYHYSNRVAVLEYHHIDPTPSDFTVTPDMFRQHLQTLVDHHYNVISMETFLDFLDGRGTVPPDAVVLTFDDGYASFYQYAYPILKEFGMTATNFLIVGYLDSTDQTPPFLKWDEIQRMKKDGFSFYSHTFMSHDFASDAAGKPIDALSNRIYLANEKRTETEAEYEKRVLGDLTKANAVIQSKLGAQANLFCMPHGRYNEKFLELGKKAGIQRYFTGIDGLNAPGTTMVRRINAGSANVGTDRLLGKLKDEVTLTGHMKIMLKNWIVERRNKE